MLGQPMAMLIPEVVGFELHRQAAAGRDRDRPRAHRHRRCCARRASSTSSSSSTAPGIARAVAARPRDDREHGARVRRDDGLLPRRRRDARRTCASPAAPTSTSQLVERYTQGEPAVARPEREAAVRRHAVARPRRRSSRRSPARRARRIACRSRRRAARGARRSAASSATRPARRRRRSTRGPNEGGARGARAVAADARRSPTDKGTFHARSRRGRDRRDHELHEHVEPVGAAWPPACSRRRRSRRASRSKPWVKTSLAPGSQVVTDYLTEAGVMAHARDARLLPRRLRLHDVHRQLGPGRTTTIAAAVKDGNLVVASVLSGNRNFEGRVNPVVRANYLASPPLVVAYALAGTMNIDLDTEPLGTGSDGKPVYPARHLADAGRGRRGDAQGDQARAVRAALRARPRGRRRLARARRSRPATRSRGTTRRRTSASRRSSTTSARRRSRSPTSTARACSRSSATRSPPITSRRPATSPRARPAARYLDEHGVKPRGLQPVRRAPRQPRGHGARHVREHPPQEPDARRASRAATRKHMPRRRRADADLRRGDASTQPTNVPLVVIAGDQYGTGSSRDWAAKGTLLLGVRAVIAKSFERIHRSNLIGMGVLPLQFEPGEDARDARPHRRRGHRDRRHRGGRHRRRSG